MDVESEGEEEGEDDHEFEQPKGIGDWKRGR